MTHDRERVLGYWDRDDVESMYDKHLLASEIDLIRRRIPPGSKVLDAGCGEGEGTLAYASIRGVRIHAADFSTTRLAKARVRLQACPNVELRHVDFLGQYTLDADYDVVVSQRFLINLLDRQLQERVLLDLMGLLRPGGRLLMLEGWEEGVASLNAFRACLGLEPIPVKWHNLFFEHERLVTFMASHGFRLVDEDGLGAYFLLTRGVRPALDVDLDWDCEFNRRAALPATAGALALGSRFSRLKLWAFEK